MLHFTSIDAFLGTRGCGQEATLLPPPWCYSSNIDTMLWAIHMLVTQVGVLHEVMLSVTLQGVFPRHAGHCLHSITPLATPGDAAHSLCALQCAVSVSQFSPCAPLTSVHVLTCLGYQLMCAVCFSRRILSFAAFTFFHRATSNIIEQDP